MFSSFVLPTSLFAALSFFSSQVSADVPNYYNDSDYQRGHYGVYPLQTYISNPDILAPVPNVLMAPQDGISPSEYIIWTPVAPHSPHKGPSILDAKTLSLVYQAPVYDKESIGATVQQCNGTDYLTWWAGDGLNGRKAGKYVMFSTNYTNVYNVSSIGDLRYGDAHEFLLTPNCTAIFTSYQAQEYDLTAYNVSNGWLLDSYFQEVDIATNELLFQWQATQHVNVSDSFLTPNMSGQGKSVYDPFDFFHINSVEKDEQGNYLVSSRHMRSLYYVNGSSGEIQWTLGGRQNQFTDLSGGNATNFAWQHHARWASADRTAISLFDNKNSKYEMAADPVSRGIILSLDKTNMTVTLNASYSATTDIKAIREGSMQLLPDTNGNVMLGYGNEPGLTEFSANGTVLWDVRFGPLNLDRDSADNYRVLKVNWTGTPSWSPRIAAGPANATTQILPSHLRVAQNNTVNDTAYFSWNGATEVAAWVILASNTTASLNSTSQIWTTVPKTGFETNITVGAYARYIRALAVNPNGRTLAATPVLDMQTGNTTTAPFDLPTYNAAEGSIFGSTFKLLAARLRAVKATTNWKVAAGVAGGIVGVSILGLCIWLYCRRQRLAQSWHQKIAGGYSHVSLVDDAFDVSAKVEAGIAVKEVDDEAETSELMEYDEKEEDRVNDCK